MSAVRQSDSTTQICLQHGNKFKMRNDFEKFVSKNQDSDGAGITFGVVDIDFFKSFNKKQWQSHR